MPKISKAIKNGVAYDFHDASIGSIASDHLEDKVPVGELYTLSDNIFAQAVPKLDDSIIDQEIGNISDNTQIHIQRIASGTASNKLKLKIKKVGTPGDLTVQVMKGISVVVTADIEAYWYGDSSNIIASGTLSAANVTTSYQELEVTLNANFGGTKEELLNVVLSQSSVDASNYYVIACDSTQWSEGYSFVAVNGNTRTRSKLMPYCISDGFSECFLSKSSSDTITGIAPLTTGITETASFSAGDDAYNTGGTYDTYTFTNPSSNSIELSLRWKGSIGASSNVWAHLSYEIDGTDTIIWEVYDHGSATYNLDETKNNITLGANKTLKIKYRGRYSWGSISVTRQLIEITYPSEILISKPTNYKEIKVYDEAGLGTEVSAYTFGRMPDGEWFSDENNGPDYMYYSGFPTCWRFFVLGNIIVFHYALPNYADTWYIKMFDLNTKQYNGVEITTPNGLYMSGNPDTVYIKYDDPTQFGYYYSQSGYNTTYFKFEFKLDGTIVSAYRGSSDPGALTGYTAVPINAESFNMGSKTMYCKDGQLLTLENNLIYTS